MGVRKIASHGRGRFEDREGFVLPFVIFGLLLMSTMAMASMLMSDDEHRAGRAMRQSTAAFYAAEAGLHETLASLDTNSTVIDTLSPGNSVTLSWQTLTGGSKYRVTVHRWDDGGQPIYELEVEGQGAGSISGQRSLSMVLTSAPGGPGDVYMLGDCCDATMTLRGELDLNSRAYSTLPYKGEIELSGLDTHPPGWEAAGVCSDAYYDKPAVIMEDSSLHVDDYPMISSSCDQYPGNVCPVTIEGAPNGIVEDPSVTSTSFDQFGDLSWDELKALADHTLGAWGTQEKYEGDEVYPRYNGDGTCDTSHPLNWGSDDPDDPCFDYMPIILLRGEIEWRKAWDPERAYGQGMLILDWDDATSRGTELELGRDGIYNGIVLGKGCVEIQKGHQFHGSIYVDHSYSGPSCDAGGAYIDCPGTDSSSGGMCDNTTVQFSQCAVDRVLKNASALSGYVEASVAGGSGCIQLLGKRAFGEYFY
jgi:hypothetical protein